MPAWIRIVNFVSARIRRAVWLVLAVAAVGSLLLLAEMGALASSAGGAKVLVGAARVTFWGAVAMAATAAIGALFGTTVA